MGKGNASWPQSGHRRSQGPRWHRTPVEVGDWVVTNRWGFSRCRIYNVPPAANSRDFDRFTFEQNTYLGPVMEIQHTEKFVAVKVPFDPAKWDCASTSGWVNIWIVKHPRHQDLGVRIAQVVPANQRRWWRLQGWQDEQHELTTNNPDTPDTAGGPHEHAA